MFIRRIRYWLNSAKRRRDLLAEMQCHIEEKAAELLADGFSEAEAYMEARRRFGNVFLQQEHSREVWIPRYCSDIVQDLRHAGRVIRRSPGFAAVAVLSLSIGIGANTSIFSAVNAVMLRRLPVKQPLQLREIDWWSPKHSFAPSTSSSGRQSPTGDNIIEYLSYPAFQYLRDHTQSFSSLAVFTYTGANLGVAGGAEKALVDIVSGNYFEMLGVEIILGRPLTPEDDKADVQSPVAVISHRFWQRAFNGDRGVIGQSVKINGTPFVIVGVTAESFIGVDSLFPPDLTV